MIPKPPPVTVRDELRKGKSAEVGEPKSPVAPDAGETGAKRQAAFGAKPGDR